MAAKTENKPSAGAKPRTLLTALLERGAYPQAIAYLSGALSGLAELPRPAKYQRQIALDIAEEVSVWLEAREKAEAEASTRED